MLLTNHSAQDVNVLANSKDDKNHLVCVGRPIETSISGDPQPHPQSLRFLEVEDGHFRNFEVF